jgi:hypothetical protein
VGDQPNTPDLIDERTARQLIARALEHQDMQASLIRVADLRSALAEIGVSADAFDAAREAMLHAELADKAWPMSLLRAGTVGVALGSAAAMLIALLPASNPIGPFALIAGSMVSGAYALRSRGGRRHLSFQLSNASLWAGFSCSAAVLTTWANGSNFVWAWSPFVAMWAFTSVAGAIAGIVRESTRNPTKPNSGVVTGIRRALGRVLRWATSKVDPQLRQSAPQIQ